VLVGVLAVVLVVVVAVGAVVLLRGDDHKADGDSRSRPAAPESVEFRRVVKAEPGTCDSAPTGVACDSAGNRYSLGEVELDGSHVTEVKVVAGQNSDWYVNLKLDSEGTRLFGDLTTDLAAKTPPQNQLAIVVRGRVVSAPTVMSAITGGDVQIASNFSKQDAEKLAADITG
jgi:preprotein translocase subunit SecD